MDISIIGTLKNKVIKVVVLDEERKELVKANDPV